MSNIVIAGFGTVGQGIWQILQEQRHRLTALPGGAPQVASILVRDRLKQRDTQVPEHLLTEDIDSFLGAPDIEVLLEATGDTELGYQLVARAMRQGIHVVTASKALVSAHMEELHRLAEQHSVHFLYEASVGGGTPLIKPLKDLPWLGEVTSLRGIINGSCNFILDAMTRQGKTFSDVTAEAQRLGYLEADADADLLGWDARRKLRILSTLAFQGMVQEADIPCAGISRITAEDISALSSAGYTVKLLGSARCTGKIIVASVFPHALAANDVLAGVGDAYNYVEVEGAYFDTVGFFGSGAGRYPTAHAMVNDLADVLLNRQPLRSPLGQESLLPTGNSQMAPFYLRGVPMNEVPVRETLEPGVLTQVMPLGDVMDLLDRYPQACATMMPE